MADSTQFHDDFDELYDGENEEELLTVVVNSLMYEAEERVLPKGDSNHVPCDMATTTLMLQLEHFRKNLPEIRKRLDYLLNVYHSV